MDSLSAALTLDEALRHHADLPHLEFISVLRDSRYDGMVRGDKHKAALGHLCEHKVGGW
jgi:hypothetical protein